LQGFTIPCIARNTFGTVFAGSENNGLFYTNNNGLNWFPHPNIDTNSTVHEIDVKDSVIIVAATSGIYLSTDWGVNFTNIGLSGEFNFDVAIHKSSPEIEIYCSTINGLQYYSTNTLSWTIVNAPELNNQLVMGIASDETNIYISNFSNSLIIKSSDGGITWSYLSNSPISTSLNDIYIDPLNNNRILTCLQGTYNIGGLFNKESIYETNNGGVSWTRKGPEAHALCITPNPINSNSFYLGTFSKGLFKTSNSFNTYTNLISGNKMIGDIAISNADTNIILLSEVDFNLSTASIKRSINGGGSFTTVASLITNRIIFNSNDNDTVYAATDDGVYISTNSGISWNSWILSGENISALAYSNNKLYAGNDQGYLYKVENTMVSNISGTWQVPVEIKSIYTLNNELFVGLNGAEKDTTYNLHGSIWRSSNGGTLWSNITYQMTSTNIFGNNIIDSDGNNLYVGTYSGGIFKLNGLVLSLKESRSKHGIVMFPNPASDIVYIESNIEIIFDLKVYNILGQDLTSTVKTTVYNKRATVDLSELLTGIYIIKINETTSNKVYKK